MRRFGLIGKTLKHSFSKTYFSKKFIEEGIKDCSYENFELSSIRELSSIITGPDRLDGFNITIPYKEEVLAFLNERNEAVEKIGACNCVRIREGKLTGFNTDAPAFKASLQSHLQSHHQCALVLGSGGASKAVQYALKELGIDFLVISRNKKGGQLGYEEVGTKLIEEHQIIINTTPLGMYPNVNDDPPIPYAAIGAKHLLFDLTYNPPKTKFLTQGERNGAIIMNGYDMLVAQAEESWRIWNEE
ncbi:MAG TPA: shikimate dehydrogenase [Flavisolibacter sp.]|nr:shikimate dehydrogenase [Flavisolibacter sp.]